MTTSGSVTPQVSSDYGTDHDDVESETEHDWQAEYQNLFAKTMKMLKMNDKVAKKNNGKYRRLSCQRRILKLSGSRKKTLLLYWYTLC